MPYDEPVIRTDAPIAPRERTDNVASHIAEYGRGGLHSVATEAARNAIPSQRLTVGMLVYIVAEDRYDKLTAITPSVTWAEDVVGSGSTTTIPTQRIAGRVSSGTGAIEALTLGDGLEFDGTSVRVDNAVTDQIDAIETTVDGYAGGIDGGTW